MKKSVRGFTIVELLIVIVVIGILVAITIVAYSSVQTRAYNTRVVAGVSQYLKLVEAYQGIEGRYPATTRELDDQMIGLACLGTGYQDQFCGRVSWNDTYEDPYLVSELNKVGTGGNIADVLLTPGPETFVGAVYGIDMVDEEYSSTSFARTIQYALKGTSPDCKISGSYSYRQVDDTVACEIILETVPARW